MITIRRDKGSALTHEELDDNFEELDKIPNGKVFPKTKGKGIQLDTDSPDFGWHDLVGFIYGDTNLPNAAQQLVYRGGIRARYFNEGDEAFVDFHIPHDYVPNTPIYIHVHWSHISNLVTGGSTTWGFECMYAKGHQQGAFIEPVNISVIQSANSTPYWHHIAETVASTGGGSAVLLDTNELEVDGIIQCRVYLDSNDITTSDASIVNPFVHFVDIHYQSTGLPTKNRAPDFWT